MARSVGEAAATGLESGLHLGMGIANQRRQMDRQDTQDAMYAEDRQRSIMRQQMADQGSALDAQLKDLNSEGQAMESSPTPPTPEQQADYTQRVSTVKSARDAHYAKLSGVVLQHAHEGALADLKALDAGDLSKVQNLTRAVTVGTGQDPKLYLRGQDKDGQPVPAPIEQAGAAMVQGIQNGDQAAMVQGANVIFGPKLQEGLGGPSPHGGVIVRKEIAGVAPDPNASADNPRFIPMLKVYVRKDNFNGPGDPDNGGATSTYMAPLTEGRATGSNAKVKSLSLKDVMDFVGHNLHLAELLSQPEGMQKLQQDQEAGTFDPQQYLAAADQYQSALQKAGVQPAKKTVTRTVIPAGASVLQETTDSRTGAVTSSKVTQGNAKPGLVDDITKFARGVDNQVADGVLSEEDGAQAKLDFIKRKTSSASEETKNAMIDQIQGDDSLSDAQKAEQIKAVRSGIKPSTAKGGLSPTDKADMAVKGRRLQVLKDERLAFENDRKTALEEYKLASHEANKKDAAAAKAAYDAKVRALDGKKADLDSRIKKISDELDAIDVKGAKSEEGSAPSGDAPPLGSRGKVSDATQSERDGEAGRLMIRSELGGDVTRAKAEIARIDAEIKKAPNNDAKNILKQQGDRLRAGVSTWLAKGSGQTTALPTNKADLKTGTLYQTARGPATWNGSAFEAKK